MTADESDSERLRAIPNGSGRLQTIPDDSKRLRIMLREPTFRSRFRNYRSRIRVDFGIFANFTYHCSGRLRTVPTIPTAPPAGYKFGVLHLPYGTASDLGVVSRKQFWIFVQFIHHYRQARAFKSQLLYLVPHAVSPVINDGNVNLDGYVMVIPTHARDDFKEHLSYEQPALLYGKTPNKLGKHPNGYYVSFVTEPSLEMLRQVT